MASPYILLGLAAAGLLHVLIPAHKDRPLVGATRLWRYRSGCLSGLYRAAPVLLRVVPVTIELARKGASREASLAFLVSTPETGVDSILITYGLMGTRHGRGAAAGSPCSPVSWPPRLP